MTVRSILATKGHHVTTIAPNRTLLDAVNLLAKKRIGAVIVAAPDGVMFGILSERDVVRALAQQGASVLDGAVATVMTEHVVTCEPDEAVDVILTRMTEGKFRHMPVLEDERLIGIVSIGDLVKYRIDEVEREHRALKDYILTA